MKKLLRACVLLAGMVGSSACASPAVDKTSPPPAVQSVAPVEQTADAYLRAIDGVTYTQMTADVERQLTSFVAGKATTHVFRDVALRSSPAKLRIVVIEMSDAYAATKPLDETHGMGGPNAYPDKRLIAGLPTFFHTDVTPNFLAWQQRQTLALVYGSDRVAMESLALSLVLANR
jgi:hypothetical protein